MSVLKGKGMYLWIANRVEGGREDRPVVKHAEIAAACAAAGMTHLMVKATNGLLAYNQWALYQRTDGSWWPTWTSTRADAVDLLAPLPASLLAEGVDPWGWGYVFGIDPKAEARLIVNSILKYGWKGYVLNCEVQWKGMENVNLNGAQVSTIPVRELKQRAHDFMGELRAGVGPDYPLAFSSFKYLTNHAPLPFEVFLSYCQIAMPQVYWMGINHDTAPAAQLERSLREYGALAPHAQLVPTGAAFFEQGWATRPSEVMAYLVECERRSLEAVNFWEYSDARHRDSSLWDALAKYPWPGSVPVPPIGADDPRHGGRSNAWWRLIGRLAPRPI